MSEQTIEELKSAFRGPVIQAADAGYDAACKVYNAMINKRPRVIARCVDAADVMAAVKFGAANGLLTAIRGGGHNGAGLGTCDGGLVIDLSLMKGVRVDPTTRTVRVGGGCVWGEVDHATFPFGAAVPCGFIASTGVGGLTLGGGIGYLSRQYGLTIDSLLSVDMVLADGSFVIASADENSDLFWAVRGGGGNFGVVTSFEFRMHPAGMVQFGPTFWPLEEAADVLRAYSKFILTAPEDVSGFFAFLVVPPVPMFPKHLHNRTVCGVVWCSTGSAEHMEEATRSLRLMGNPVLDGVGPAPFPVVQSLFDGLFQPGMQWYWKADYFTEVTEEAIARHVEHGSRLPNMFSTMHLYPVNGAAQRVGRNDTAYSFREALFAEVIVGVDPDPANCDLIANWCRNYFDALHPYSAGGAYVNFMMEEGQDRVQATYRDNYPRLAAIKKKYDPANFFRVNQNIHPEGN